MGWGKNQDLVIAFPSQSSHLMATQAAHGMTFVAQVSQEAMASVEVTKRPWEEPTVSNVSTFRGEVATFVQWLKSDESLEANNCFSAESAIGH